MLSEVEEVHQSACSKFVFHLGLIICFYYFPGEAGVYMATVLEYLVAEILEVAGDATKQAKKRRITPRSIMLSVRSDEELSALTKKVHFAESGAIPFIAPVLLQKPLKKRKKNHVENETMEEDVNNNEAGSSKFQWIFWNGKNLKVFVIRISKRFGLLICNEIDCLDYYYWGDICIRVLFLDTGNFRAGNLRAFHCCFSILFVTFLILECLLILLSVICYCFQYFV